jgi:hypothetical protein
MGVLMSHRPDRHATIRHRATAMQSQLCKSLAMNRKMRRPDIAARPSYRVYRIAITP